MSSILVVDDMEDARSMIRAILESDGHDVAEAENGHRAIAALAEGRFDIVVTDILMPESDGIELIRLISGDPKLGIIAMSGGGSYISAAVSLELARATGAARILRKPFRKPELLAAVAAVIAMQASHPPSAPSAGTQGTLAP
jgi:CheY-like chemotaxis protein